MFGGCSDKFGRMYKKVAFFFHFLSVVKVGCLTWNANFELNLPTLVQTAFEIGLVAR